MLKFLPIKPVKPYLPMAPYEPKEFIMEKRYIPIIDNDFSINELENYIFSQLPIGHGIHLNDIRICIKSNSIDIYYIRQCKNESYDLQIKQYNKHVIRYEEDMRNYFVKLEEYKKDFIEFVKIKKDNKVDILSYKFHAQAIGISEKEINLVWGENESIIKKQ
jgi:hypothetical protein